MRKKPDASLELYDLGSDISEKNNVVKKYPDVAKKIEEIMLTARTKPDCPKFRFGEYPESI